MPLKLYKPSVFDEAFAALGKTLPNCMSAYMAVFARAKQKKWLANQSDAVSVRLGKECRIAAACNHTFVQSAKNNEVWRLASDTDTADCLARDKTN
uniref:Uncharacterized protein n=1 Tax=Oryza rufipogon TaxID=4529 RepID=A0A0E0N154_ORYRU